ncbi:hypothetical protein IWX90DRAFT_123324 [Phyllosticta citrichinensis]|uniref:Uncharacterized protein n=1 Tax=Phyllosticta citrichinensis TaxID=1130410 RepID=A0ABR1Y3S8_9PEZI
MTGKRKHAHPSHRRGCEILHVFSTRFGLCPQATKIVVVDIIALWRHPCAKCRWRQLLQSNFFHSMPSFPRIVLMVTSRYTWFAAYVHLGNQYALRLSRNIASQPALTLCTTSGLCIRKLYSTKGDARRTPRNNETPFSPFARLQSCSPSGIVRPSPSPYDVGEHTALSLGCLAQHQTPCYPRKHALMHRARAMGTLLLHTLGPRARTHACAPSQVAYSQMYPSLSSAFLTHSE